MQSHQSEASSLIFSSVLNYFKMLSTSSTELDHVIIAGGGLGGLSAARSFHYIFPRHNVKVPRLTVYERERAEAGPQHGKAAVITLVRSRSKKSNYFYQ